MHKGISRRRRKARVLKVLVPFFAQSPQQDILKETLAVILMSDVVTIKLPKVKQKYVRFEDLGARHSFTWD